MIDFLRPFLSRIIAPVVASIVAWLAVRYGIVVDPDVATTRVLEAVIAIFGILAPLSGIIKQIIDRKINPGNAAHPKLAAIEKLEARNPLIQPGVPRRDPYVRPK